MDTLSRSLLLMGPRRLEWIQERLAQPASDGALVRTLAGAISIGSELPQYLGTARSSAATRYPHMTGYESVGIVVSVGASVERLRPGARVVAFYGHRTAALTPESKTILVPDDISNQFALLAILTCDAAKCVRKIAPLPEEPALVTGGGAMGLFILFMLKAYGVAVVDVIEPDEQRHALALALGARSVLRPDEVAAQADDYAVGFECSARNDAFAFLQRRLVPNGRIGVVSDGNVETLSLTPAFHEKELRIVGSSDGWDYRQHAAWYFDYLRRNPSPLADVFELEIEANELATTFERLATRVVTPVKALVRYV